MLKPLEAYFARRARGLVFPAESYARTFLQAAGLRRPYLLTANVPRTQPAGRGSALRDLVAETGRRARFIVHYQGSIGPGKGLAAAIRSIPYWPQGAVLTLQGLVRPSGYKQALLELARSVGVEGRVAYVGVTSYDRVLEYTRSADVGVFLPTARTVHSLNSGVANNKVMEYMAYGVPSVVAPVPGLKALMDETGAGVVVDPSDPRAVGLAVTQLLTDKTRWTRHSRSARKAHLAKYNFEHQYAPVLDVLDRLVHGGREAASRRAA
jgi:glycosyltransferase involved in cell wall biosynthesis